MSAERRARRGFLRTFLLLFLPCAIALLIVGKAELPSDTTVGSNIPDPYPTRTLAPRVTTTTSPHAEPRREVIVIVGDRVIRLPETPAVMILLSLAEKS